MGVPRARDGLSRRQPVRRHYWVQQLPAAHAVNPAVTAGGIRSDDDGDGGAAAVVTPIIGMMPGIIIMFGTTIIMIIIMQQHEPTMTGMPASPRNDAYMDLNFGNAGLVRTRPFAPVATLEPEIISMAPRVRASAATA